MGQDMRGNIMVCALLYVALGLSLLLSLASAATPIENPLPHEPRFIRFGAEHGLSSTINDLAIDRQGYVWVATGDGLARYDGTGFRHWRRVIGDPASLPDNEVTLIHVDAHDRLWAATWFALSVLDPDQRVPKAIKFSGDATRCGIDITAMTSTPEGVVWLGNRAGDLCKVNLNGTAERFFDKAERRSFFGFSFAVTIKAMCSGCFLVGTDSGLWWVDVSRDHVRSRKIHTNKTQDNAVFILSEEFESMVWVGAENGLFLVDRKGDLIKTTFALPENSRRAVVMKTREGTRWIGSYYGLHLRHESPHFPSRKNHDFMVDGISRILEDNEGGIWFASYSQGLLFLPKSSSIFSIFNSESNHFERVFLGEDSFSTKKSYLSKNRGKKIEYIAICGNKDVLILSSGEISYNSLKKDITNKNFHSIKLDEKNRIEVFSCSPSNDIWISKMGGGLSLYSKNGSFIREFSPQETLGEEAEAFIDLRFSPDGSPWYSDGVHLRRWDGRDFVRVPLPPGEYVYALDFVSATELWVSRFGSLERYEWNGVDLRLRERVAGEEGLPAVEVRSVLATSTGNVWLNTARGLVQYDMRQRRARLFGLRDGLPGLDFTLDVLKRRVDGPAIATSKEGVVMFDPDLPLPVPRASSLVIETIDLRRGEDVVRFPRLGDAELSALMKPGDRDLRIAAKVMSFADPTAYRYRSRLHGYDSDWVDQGDRGERMFSSLAPGRYLLELQGANADGVWSATRQISVTVEAPWWQRWWAFASYAIAAAMFLYWIAYLYRLRLKRRHDYELISQKREVAEQASLAKSRFLANLGHEVRTPMTGVLGMSELLLSTSLDTKQQGHVQAISRAGEHLLRLVNDALDLARIEAGRLELEHVDFDIDALVEEVVALMHPMAQRKGLALRVHIAPGASGRWRGDPTRIRQILLNLVGNALKFTDHGEVALSVETEGSAVGSAVLILRVSDTGPGLDTQQQQRLFRRFEQADGARTASRYGGSGLGLAICQELATAMSGGIALRSALGEGTCFTVRLALERAKGVDLQKPAQQHNGVQVARDVLLVEDDPIVADVLTGMLQAQGHRAVHAGHALAAMTEMAMRGFDIVLIDFDLPGMDGLAFAGQLRAQGASMPLIAITASAESGAEMEATAVGFDAFLRKPLTGDALADTLREVFVRRAAA